MGKEIRDALKVDLVVDITTTGRKTGQPRRIEILSHNLDGQVIVVAMPPPRGWYANMVANPEITFHLKKDVQADIPAKARPVTDEAERRAIFTKLKGMSQFEQRVALDVEEWVKNNRLIEISFS